MSCHVEIDFHDDGSITMTGRAAKGEEPRAVKYKDGEALGSNEAIVIPILGGNTDDRTHGIVIAGWPAIRKIQHMTIVPSRAVGVFAYCEWAS